MEMMVGAGLPSRGPAGRDARCRIFASEAGGGGKCLVLGGGSVEGRRQELLWRQFFMEHTLWWDNRELKKSSRSPDFRRKNSHEVLWLNSLHKPAWVDEQLAALDMEMEMEMGRRPSRSPIDDGCGRRSGLMAEMGMELCEQGRVAEAVEVLEGRLRTGYRVSISLFCAVLKRCVGDEELVLGRRVHALALERGYESDACLCNHLLRMYASHARLQEAMDVFSVVAQPDVFTWSAIISAHVRHGQPKQAIELYRQMCRSGVKPSGHVFVATLQACAREADLETGQEVHAYVLASGVGLDSFVCTSLVDMYAKCGSLEDAKRVFDALGHKNVVTWNSMIAGYSQQGMAEEAFCSYSRMQQERIIAPDSVTFVCLLQACASVGTPALEKGKQFHAQIVEQGLQALDSVVNSLINMYVKCGSLEDARRVFERLGPRKDAVAWTSLIAGYSQQNMGREALHLYRSMQQEGIAAPDSVTFLCLLQACGSVAALNVGRQLHEQIKNQGLETDVTVGTSLIDMYAKSGSMVDAQQVFDALPKPDVFTWNALIAGYARQGDNEAVCGLFDRMKETGTQPDSVVFLSLLTACSHVGLVDRGREYFNAMSKNYGLTPTVEHYTCMVDLLGRAGQVDEALEVARTMHVQPDAAVWSTLLGACQKWRDKQVGRLAFDDATKLNSKDSTSYVLMSNIYAASQMWEEAQEMHVERKRNGAWKPPGHSCWADLEGRVHTFWAC